jgi:hypothetical protein
VMVCSSRWWSRNTPVKNPGRNSFGALLGVLRLALVVVEDDKPAAPLPRRRYRRKGFATPMFALTQQGATLLVMGWTARQ